MQVEVVDVILKKSLEMPDDSKHFECVAPNKMMGGFVDADKVKPEDFTHEKLYYEIVNYRLVTGRTLHVALHVPSILKNIPVLAGAIKLRTQELEKLHEHVCMNYNMTIKSAADRIKGLEEIIHKQDKIIRSTMEYRIVEFFKSIEQAWTNYWKVGE